MFTTEKNLKLLDQYHDQCLGDATFDVAPTFFKQVYTIHILVNGKFFLWFMVSCQAKNKQPIKYSLK